MPPMKKPAPPRDPAWQATWSIDAFARQHRLKRRQVLQHLQQGELPFVQIQGEIRIPQDAALPRCHA